MKKWLLQVIHHQQASLNDIQRQYEWGTISQAQYEAYCRVWLWLNVRWGGEPSRRQDIYWERHGSAAFYGRINRYRTAFNLAPLTIPPALASEARP